MSDTEFRNRLAPEVSKHMRVTLPIVLSAIGLAIMGTTYYANLRGDISELKKSQWTITDQLQWSLEIKSANPGLTVPIPTVPNSPFSVASNKFISNSIVAVIIKK